MRFDLITIFPEFFTGPLDHGIVRRAREAGIIEARVHDLRNWTRDKHRTVDDRPFGGGEGMVLKPEPIFEAVEAVSGEPAEARSAAGSGPSAPASAIVLLSASGRSFCQAEARRLAQLERIVLICGRYEGVDERVAEHLATDELSIGDFVLSGGELPAAIVLDAVTRLLPGALGNEASSVHESFSASDAGEVASAPSALLRASEWRVTSEELPAGDSSLACPEQSRRGTRHSLLDCPHYTRPAEFRGWGVPEALLSGNHEQIRRWRQQAALEKTRRNRPDLLAGQSTARDL